MDYFVWNLGGDVDDTSLCFIQDPPEGMGLDAVTLSVGEPAKQYVPEDPRIRLRNEDRGLALPGFIGNTRGLLILSGRGIEVLKRMCEGQNVEIFPFALINHKNRVHSTDYSIVNPLDTLECLDQEASEIERDVSGEVLAVERLILSKRRVEGAPHLFRIAEKPVKYVFSRALGIALRDAGVTNIRGEPLPQV